MVIENTNKIKKCKIGPESNFYKDAQNAVCPMPIYMFEEKGFSP